MTSLPMPWLHDVQSCDNNGPVLGLHMTLLRTEIRVLPYHGLKKRIAGVHGERIQALIEEYQAL